jgi:hypothetical protein
VQVEVALARWHSRLKRAFNMVSDLERQRRRLTKELGGGAPIPVKLTHEQIREAVKAEAEAKVEPSLNDALDQTLAPKPNGKPKPKRQRKPKLLADTAPPERAAAREARMISMGFRKTK